MTRDALEDRQRWCVRLLLCCSTCGLTTPIVPLPSTSNVSNATNNQTAATTLSVHLLRSSRSFFVPPSHAVSECAVSALTFDHLQLCVAAECADDCQELTERQALVAVDVDDVEQMMQEGRRGIRHEQVVELGRCDLTARAAPQHTVHREKGVRLRDRKGWS